MTRLDVTPLTLSQEIVAKIMGRRTHQIHRTAESFETTPRRGAYLKAATAIVLGDHICDLSAFRFGEVAPEYFNRPITKQSSEGVPFRLPAPFANVLTLRLPADIADLP